MENKNIETSPKNPPVDPRNVLEAAMEPGAPNFYDEVVITGVTSRQVLGREVPRFTILVGSGENKRMGELSAIPEEVARYNEELKKLK